MCLFVGLAIEIEQAYDGVVAIENRDFASGEQAYLFENVFYIRGECASCDFFEVHDGFPTAPLVFLR